MATDAKYYGLTKHDIETAADHLRSSKAHACAALRCLRDISKLDARDKSYGGRYAISGTVLREAANVVLSVTSRAISLVS